MGSGHLVLPGRPFVILSATSTPRTWKVRPKFRFGIKWTHALQVRKIKDYTPFPPAPKPSKVDLALESGEYFLSKEIKAAKAAAEKKQAQAEKVSARKRQRTEAFQVPVVSFDEPHCMLVDCGLFAEAWFLCLQSAKH